MGKLILHLKLLQSTVRIEFSINNLFSLIFNDFTILFKTYFNLN